MASLQQIYATTNLFLNTLNDNSILYYKNIVDLLKDSLEEAKNMDFNLETITRMTLENKIANLNDFYQKEHIDINVNELISNGTINFISYENYLVGCNYYDGNHRVIDVSNNGLLMENEILVHELSHYQNQTFNGRGEVNNMLTEALAYFEGLVYLDYLKDIGYELDALELKKYFILMLQQELKKCYGLLKMLWCFSNMGTITKKDYQYFYNSQDNEEITTDYLENLKYFYQSYQNNFPIYRDIWLILTGLLTPYMYNQSQLDESFKRTIRQLNTEINVLSLDDVLKKLGIDDINGEIFDLSFELEKFIREVKNEEEILRRKRI